MRLLLAHAVGRVIYVILFENGVGMNQLWRFSSLGQVLTGLIKLTTVPGIADLEIRWTAYFPKYMAQLFSRPSGTVMFRTHNYLNMEIPLNIANYLDEMKQIVIRNGNRTWNVAIGLGHFLGEQWSNLCKGLWTDDRLSFVLLQQYCH
ncbi:hypothetical protein LIER_24748 [Lithospermum erythrorhizon]|uniref:Uncharacterized protein n=1 Tax=Lithospermum erythrorhizon TaxID=34254 RepID=A0AAV3R6B0_LITER